MNPIKVRETSSSNLIWNKMKVVFFTYIAQYSIHLSFIIAINCTLLLTNIFDIIISSTLHFFLQEASVKGYV